MAFETLDPVSLLWRGFGLEYLLIPREQRRSASPARLAWKKTEKKAARADPEAAASVQPAKPAQQARPARIDWPVLWQEQLKLARKGIVAWTYLDLGPDLLAARTASEKDEARVRRGQLLRRILRDLNHKPGTHTFWPLLLEQEPSPELFWDGIAKLGSRYVFIFGADAGSLLTGIATPAMFLQWRGRGRLAWILPAIDKIDDRNYGRILAFIRTSLSALAIG